MESHNNNQLISVDEALTLIGQSEPVTLTEKIELGHASGRVLAKNVTAKLDQPPHSFSAMDGFAVNANSISKGDRLALVGESAAGHPFIGGLEEGEAVRIYTGARVPNGTVRVVIQENVHQDGQFIVITEANADHSHIRPRGIDFSKDSILAWAGQRLGFAHLSLIAAADNPQVEVYCRPKVALLSNGDELTIPGDRNKDSQIIESVSFGLAALLQNWGVEVINLGIARDNIESILEKLNNAATYDLIIPIGGASVGDYDFMQDAFARLGYAPVFSKVKVKPGKPVWFSQVTTCDGHEASHKKRYALGLPGNPASALVCALLFVQPLINRLSNAIREDEPIMFEKAILGHDLPKNGARETFLRASIERIASDQQEQIFVRHSQDSSLLSPLASCQVLLRRKPHAMPRQKGDQVEIIRYP